MHARRIGVPRDRAFCFYYEENLRILDKSGAVIVLFQPTEGDGVPPDLDGLYLGGGYPEIHAARLSANEAFLDGLRAAHDRGTPIYAECGGFMVLCRELQDTAGGHHAISGIFPTRAHMGGRRFSLGYRQITMTGLPRIEEIAARGHEFQYSYTKPMPKDIPRAYRIRNARDEDLPPEGNLSGRTLGGYIHLHFASCPTFPSRFFGREEGDGDPLPASEGIARPN